MFRKKEETREEAAKKFILGAKDQFKTLIPRDTISDIQILECDEKDGVFKLKGSVGTVSPTGKEKTFGYCAEVKVDESKNCSLTALQIS